MEMSWPYPLRSKFNAANSYDSIDYRCVPDFKPSVDALTFHQSMTVPLERDGSNFPCKGYQNDGPALPITTYTPGSTYNMTLSGSATHGGGSCQLSLSYDNGGSFRVIKSMVGGCPLQSIYDFMIPSYMPGGDALLAWSWQNKVGNREFYMNCAAVRIDGGSYSRKRRREAAASFDALPYIWRANLADAGGCSTIEGEDPVYPHPGPDVEYGGDVTSESLPSSGDCDSPVPFGQAYRARSDNDAFPSFYYEPTTSAEEAVETTVVPSSYEESGSGQTVAQTGQQMDSNESSEDTGPGFNAQARVLQASASEITTAPRYSTTTIYADCPDTITLTIYPSPSATTTITAMPSHYTTSAACTGTSASCPCARGFACDEIAPCTWACNAQPTPMPPTSRSTWSHSRSTSWTTRTTRPSSETPSTVAGSRSQTVATVRPSSTPPAQPANRPPYATGNLDRYLPCVPGTFICTSQTAWETCNWNNDGSEWVYGWPRDVSAGMLCLTSLSPYSSQTDQYAQQALTPDGYYRDDRIIRDRPDGDCDRDGSFMCTDDGQQFSVCDQGGWVRMGRVAEGTTCEDGHIVAIN